MKTPKRIFAIIILFGFIQYTFSCKILSLSGGGAHGSFQVGVLNKLHDEKKTWDVITGVSAGSLNTMMLGLFEKNNQNKGMDLIKSVWTNITQSDVYKWNWDPIYD